MTTRLERAHGLAIGSDEFARRLADPAFAVARLESARRNDPKLLSHSVSATGVRIVTRGEVPHEDLPKWMASRFPDGGPVNEREERWSTVDGLTATVTVTSPTGGSAFEGTYAVRDVAGGCTWVVEGFATMKMPIIGKRIEAFMVASLDRAYALEADFVSSDRVTEETQ